MLGKIVFGNWELLLQSTTSLWGCSLISEQGEASPLLLHLMTV